MNNMLRYMRQLGQRRQSVFELHAFDRVPDTPPPGTFGHASRSLAIGDDAESDIPDSGDDDLREER